tara:strand:- start:1412 stop:1675 length:264 start_codon:yes stop_codon:yes gene_type:complete
MKALLYKILPETETLPARVKITAHGLKPRTFFLNSDLWNANPCAPVYEQAFNMFLSDHKLHHWGKPQFGQLPNGDFVATFKDKVNGY